MDDNSGGASCGGYATSSAGDALAEGKLQSRPRSVSGMGFHTLDDFDVKGRRVLLRIDINSPVDEKKLMLVDGSKIKSSVTTIRELMDRGARVVILAHQGRPGDYDFIPLNEHANYLSQYLGRKVRYVDDLFGPYALKAIDNLAEGESVLLKNVRFFGEEQLKKSPEEHADSRLVQILMPKFDLFVNDAFASSHRSHASLVGFTAVLPSAAGRLMEKEVRTLTKVFQNPHRPSTFIFGGTKFVDALPVMEKLAERDAVDNIIVVGLAGYSFLSVLGRPIGSRTEELAKKDVTDEVAARAKSLFNAKGNKIRLPTDAAIESEGRRKEYMLDSLPPNAAILDIGSDSIKGFTKTIMGSKTVFMSGPAGVFEREEFSKGTKEILDAITSSEAFCVIGGGHSCAAANKFGVLELFSYVSTGGGALERLMLGKEMPVVEALKASAKRF